MSIYKNIFITGSIAYDTIMDFPNKFQDYFHPEKLHQINVSFVVDKLEKQLGGTATNIAYNAGLILNDKSKVKLLGSVGKDGKEFLNFFEKNNINTDGVIMDKKLYTAAGSVITDKKDNQIWGFYYGASEKIPYTDFKKINKDTGLLVISANHQNSFLYFQNQAIKNKIDYLYDPGMTLTWISDKDLEKGVVNCCYLVGNDYEIAMILKRLKKTIEEITKLGVNVITTLGEKGVIYDDDKKSYKIDGFKIKKIVDPTGAGDAWRGGFISALLMDYQINDCLKLGNVMASFAIVKYGTINHRPTKEDIEKRMNKISK